MPRNVCSRCGNVFDSESAQGLCPACLLKEAIDGTGSDSAASCGQCHAPLAGNARFCASCGTAVTAYAAGEGDPIGRALETKLAGQYRIVRLLGRGGMGAVYLARDLTLDREVAIKVVKAEVQGGAMFERFRREARTAAKLSHPNIVPLHSFGEVEGMPFFVMGYVRGESLADRLRREGRVAEESARRILADVADALDHAHRQGIVHRDVKPDNVLLDDETGRALLTDFGVAKASGRGETMTRHGSVIGTPHYMSPEQAAGHADLDGRSDIYSLGIMGFAMLAGRLPFDGATAADILAKQITQAPPRLRSFNPTASDSTAQALERCLAKDRSSRWPDARSLKIALGAVEESQLPDALQAVEGQGVLGVLVALFLLLIVRMTDAPLPVYAVNVGIVAAIFLVIGVRLRIEGFAIGESQAVIWREPAWWPLWYPSALRRRGNVWDRLPASARRVRASASAFIVLFALLLIGPFPNAYRHPLSFATKVGGFAAGFIIWDVLVLVARFDLKRRGVAPADLHRVMLSIPPSRLSFWSRPNISPILGADRAREENARADSPHDQLQSILRHGAELTGPLRPLGAQAAVAARQLVASIDEADRRIVDLARNLEPGEEERLNEKIAALTPASSGDDEYAPMRALLEQQRALIRGLSERIEVAKAARSRRVEMLRGLALHLASLRARIPDTPSQERSLSDEVRALCDEISRHAQIPADHTTAVEGPTVDRQVT